MTRKEWLAARERFLGNMPGNSQWDKVVEAVLGPCPPKSAPPSWSSCGGILSVTLEGHRVRVGFPGREATHQKLTLDEADAMAEALVDHAQFIREQEEPAPPELCGAIIDLPSTARRCQRLKYHSLPCSAWPSPRENDEPPICARLLVGPLGSRAPVLGPGHLLCGRPKGHDDGCRPTQDFLSQPEDERTE